MRLFCERNVGPKREPISPAFASTLINIYPSLFHTSVTKKEQHHPAIKMNPVLLHDFMQS